MLPYFIVLLVYLLIRELVFFLFSNITLAIASRLIVVSILLFIYRKSFKFKIKFDLLAIFTGFAIFGIWVGLDKFYPHLGEISFGEYSLIDIILKMISLVVLAPVVEEFFTRFFLIRWIIAKDWEKVEIGKYTLSSFFFSVVFFGFSHSRWLAGLITGILLNLLLYKRKNIESCILAHFLANLALGIFVIYTGNWQLW